MRDGHRALYIADSITYHRDAPQRMTMKYVLRWYYLRGKSEVRTGELARSPRMFLGVPYYLYRGLLMETFRLVTTVTRPSSGPWLAARTQLARIAGAMVEFRARSASDSAALRD
jgi:hypothetical protein